MIYDIGGLLVQQKNLILYNFVNELIVAWWGEPQQGLGDSHLLLLQWQKNMRDCKNVFQLLYG